MEAQNVSRVFIEVGAAAFGLALLARFASRLGFSAIPLYLVAGLAFGKGGIAPLHVSAGFIHVGAEIGVLLLLFMLGLEYTGDELKQNLKKGIPSGALDFALNFSPGFAAGLLLHWSPLSAVVLGGVTWVSSSGIIARVLAELGRLNAPETPAIISVLVLEDLAMAVYLPLVGVLLAGGGAGKIATSVAIAVGTVAVILVLALRHGGALSRLVQHESDEIILLTTFGAVLLLAGLAQELNVSAAIGAFLVGIALSGPIAERSKRLVAPLRDLFAATFFFFYGLEVDPRTLPGVLLLAVALGLVTALTKVLTGVWAARRAGADRRAGLRAGMSLVARGEFSIVIAGMGAGLDQRLGPLAAAYVLFLAVLGPILARVAK
jgi:CPA2 family monovalent cation:H+ antiporter-2